MANKNETNKLSNMSNQELYALCKLNLHLIDIYRNEVEANKMLQSPDYENTKNSLSEQIVFNKIIVNEIDRRIKSLI